MRGDYLDVAGDALARGDWAAFPLKNGWGTQHVRHTPAGGLLVSIWKNGKAGVVYTPTGGGKVCKGGFASIEEAKAYADKLVAPPTPGRKCGQGHYTPPKR